MKPSDVILLWVFFLFMLGLHGVAWNVIVDEWRCDKRISALFGIGSITLFDFVILAVYLRSQGH